MWKQRRIFWSFLPTNHHGHHMELSLALLGMDFTWIMYKLSNKPSFCVLLICPRPWWAYSAAWRPEDAGFLWRWSGWDTWRINLGVCSLWTYIPSQGWVTFHGVCVLCPSMIGNPDPLWFSGGGGSRPSLSWSVLVPEYVMGEGGGFFFFTESQFDVTLRTLKFMCHFPWRFKTLF